MQEVNPGWLSWRIRIGPNAPSATPPAVRLRTTMISTDADPAESAIPADFHNETPDELGIRRGLVAHVRRLIAAGHYDSPERWALAEEMLFRKLEESR